MSQLTIQCLNRLDRGEIVTQEVNATIFGFRRWIAIYPLKEERLRKKYEGFKYKVLDFELCSKLVDEFFSEEDKKNLNEYLVISETELEKVLLHIGINPQNFDAPWKNDYPL